MLKDGEYNDLEVDVFDELKEDEYIQELISCVVYFYDDILKLKEGYGIDDDTSKTSYLSGEMLDNIFYCYKLKILFEFLDEMNHVVSQQLFVDFKTGIMSIIDDDMGCIFRSTIPEFKLYDD